jgi:hypothetical protein
MRKFCIVAIAAMVLCPGLSQGNAVPYGDDTMNAPGDAARFAEQPGNPASGDIRAEKAVNLRGQWHVTIPQEPTYTAVVLIDAEGRATWDAVWDPSRRRTPSTGRSTSRGYVDRADDLRVEIVTTNGSMVGRVHCSRQSSDLLFCREVVLPNGKPSVWIILTRVGPGPKNLMPALP